MTKNTIKRQHLIEALNTLPDEALTELASFVEYLRYKTHLPKTSEPFKTNFLLTIAGLGESGQSDVSDSTREILNSEIDPIHGWSSKPENQP
jgi:hypothetical protein